MPTDFQSTYVTGGLLAAFGSGVLLLFLLHRADDHKEEAMNEAVRTGNWAEFNRLNRDPFGDAVSGLAFWATMLLIMLVLPVLMFVFYVKSLIED